MDRELTENERVALDAMLGDDVPGVREFRAQAATARVTGSCRCGCPTIDLAVDPDAPSAPPGPNPIAEAGAPQGGLLLFATDGRLSCLEYYSHTDDKPDGFPPPEQIRRD